MLTPNDVERPSYDARVQTPMRVLDNLKEAKIKNSFRYRVVRGRSRDAA